MAFKPVPRPDNKKGGPLVKKAAPKVADLSKKKVKPVMPPKKGGR